MNEEEAEILEPYELSFSDLLFSTRFQSSSSRDRKRCQSISRNVMEALGPTGPGLLCITGVLSSAILRRKLLPMARKLALFDPDKQKRILKEHYLGSDVSLKNPERDVTSFAMQLKNENKSKSSQGKLWYDEASYSIEAKLNLQEDDEFKDLGTAFKELGFCMRELGLSIARLCDREIGGGLLEQSLLESCAAKGRLIHYHSTADKCILREAYRKKQSRKRLTSKKEARNATQQEVNHRNKTGLNGSQFNLWQQWHYDYGIFTILTDPMFLSSYSYQECTLISNHSYLQIYHPRNNKFYMVKTPQDSFIVQIGESADILSKGKLQSTLHCVCKPEKLEDISRETFVVFLQPKWSQTFSVSEYTMEHLKSDEVQNIVPPLSSRLRDGMTFAEFARETTKQYYGGSGFQSAKLVRHGK